VYRHRRLRSEFAGDDLGDVALVPVCHRSSAFGCCLRHKPACLSEVLTAQFTLFAPDDDVVPSVLSCRLPSRSFHCSDVAIEKSPRATGLCETDFRIFAQMPMRITL